jgi:hypothetical protein
MKPGRIVALVFGCLAALIGIGLTIGTIFLGVVYGTQRDSDGYFSTGTVPMHSTTAVPTPTTSTSAATRIRSGGRSARVI